ERRRNAPSRVAKNRERNVCDPQRDETVVRSCASRSARSRSGPCLDSHTWTHSYCLLRRQSLIESPRQQEQDHPHKWTQQNLLEVHVGDTVLRLIQIMRQRPDRDIWVTVEKAHQHDRHSWSSQQQTERERPPRAAG